MMGSARTWRRVLYAMSLLTCVFVGMFIFVGDYRDAFVVASVAVTLVLASQLCAMAERIERIGGDKR